MTVRHNRIDLALHQLRAGQGGRDVRPPDYAATFARQAATRSGLDVAVAVVGVLRPPWLDAEARESGVEALTRDRALALFAEV